MSKKMNFKTYFVLEMDLLIDTKYKLLIICQINE